MNEHSPIDTIQETGPVKQMKEMIIKIVLPVTPDGKVIDLTKFSDRDLPPSIEIRNFDKSVHFWIPFIPAIAARFPKGATKAFFRAEVSDYDIEILDRVPPQQW